MIENCSAAILSLSGPVLTDEERGLFDDMNPFGYILFARNCETPEQLRALTDSLREVSGRENCPILIDQEGGRVQRLKPPVWRAHPPMLEFGDIALNDLDKSLETIRFVTLRMAQELMDSGVNVNCAPVLDVLFPDAHEIIGDRAFGEDPTLVGRLGLSVCRHYLAGGVIPVIKHIPGHGRAMSDSHKDLPVVDTPLAELKDIDFAPFRVVSASDCGKQLWAMTAHVIYSDIDPDHPASTSKTVIQDIIRGDIGFEGILVSDDLDMEALEGYGDVAARAKATLDAGVDLTLYCAGRLVDMQKLAESVPKLAPDTIQRLKNSQ